MSKWQAALHKTCLPNSTITKNLQIILFYTTSCMVLAWFLNLGESHSKENLDPQCLCVWNSELWQATNFCHSHLLFGVKLFPSPFILRSSITAKRIYFEKLWKKLERETVAGHLNSKCSTSWDVWQWHKENCWFLKRCSVKPEHIKSIWWRRQKSTCVGVSMLTTSEKELRLWLLHFKFPNGRVIEQFKHGGHIKQNQCMCKSDYLHCSQNTTFRMWQVIKISVFLLPKT